MAAAPQTQALEPWYEIHAPLWQGSEVEIRRGLPFSLLSPQWQMFLLGDGAPTRHLQLLTQSEIVVDVVAMTAIGTDDDHAPPEIGLIPAPRVRRQIWLRSPSTGETFSHATSWWSSAQMAAHLKDPSLPIWKSLHQKHTELYRDLKGLYCGTCPQLDGTFGAGTSYWGRHYLLWHGGQPLTLIYEIYGPTLARYLGPSCLSSDSYQLGT
jgi:chorismate lyase